MSGTTTARLRRGLAAATACAVVAAPTLLAAAPASAQTAGGLDRSGVASGQALLLSVNLPASPLTGDAENPYLLRLAIDPVSGTVRNLSSGAPEANAQATVLGLGLLSRELPPIGTAAAQLSGPTTQTNDPAAALADALKGTPLEGLLSLQLVPANAAVSDEPSSASDAKVAQLALGLPAVLADGLKPVTDGLGTALDTALTQLATAAGMASTQLCTNLPTAFDALKQVTDPVDSLLAQVLGVPEAQPLGEVLSITALQAVCNLQQTVLDVNTGLQAALDTLAGEGGLLRTGLIASSQSVTAKDGGVQATATSEIVGLRVLGQSPFAEVDVLRSTSTAVANGQPGGAKATVESTVAGLKSGAVDPFAQLRIGLTEAVGQLLNADLPPFLRTGLDGLLAQVNNALAPVGVAVTPNSAAPGFQGCPAELNGQDGTFEAEDGSCAAASTDGVGVAVTLPAALNSALGLGNRPLVQLEVVPTAAVAKVQPVAAPAPPVAPEAPKTLPRTGAEAPLAGLGAALVIGAVALRRRRATV